MTEPTPIDYSLDAAWPSDWQGSRLTGRFINTLVQSSVGTIKLKPNVPAVASIAQKVIVTMEQVEVTLDANGAFDIIIPATDDPDMNPVGWTYLVTENIPGGRTYFIEAPVNTTQDLSEIAPVSSILGEAIVRGEPGQDGKSAYEIAVDYGYTGTESEWAAEQVLETDVRTWITEEVDTEALARTDADNALGVRIDGKVGQAEVDAAVADKATTTYVDTAVADRVTATELSDGLATKADLVTGKVPDAQLPDNLTRDNELTGVLSTKADLDGNGTVPLTQIPDAIARDAEVDAKVATAIPKAEFAGKGTLLVGTGDGTYNTQAYTPDADDYVLVSKTSFQNGVTWKRAQDLPGAGGTVADSVAQVIVQNSDLTWPARSTLQGATATSTVMFIGKESNPPAAGGEGMLVNDLFVGLP